MKKILIALSLAAGLATSMQAQMRSISFINNTTTPVRASIGAAGVVEIPAQSSINTQFEEMLILSLHTNNNELINVVGAEGGDNMPRLDQVGAKIEITQQNDGSLVARCNSELQ